MYSFFTPLGMYLFKEINNKGKTKVQLLGSGAILNEVIKAAEILSSDFGIDFFK